MSKLIKNFVGIDISKKTFDAALLKEDTTQQVIHHQFKQSAEGYKSMLQWLKDNKVWVNQQTVFCMEFTGIYNSGLLDFLSNHNARVWVEMALRIKKSLGFSRTNTDKTDAIKIAQYAYRNQDDVKLWKPANADLVRIKHLIAFRDRVVRTITTLKVPVNELKAIGSVQIAKEMEQLQKGPLKQLEAAQQKTEKTIIKIIAANEDLSHCVNRVTSIKGVGSVTAVALLVYTNGFTAFQSAKQLACYCGVAPFIKKESGSSVRSKPKVSCFANMKLKKLLHLCALPAKKYDPQLKAYFERKLLEGKNRMSVINAIRNKLILRIFAVLREDRDFVQNYYRTCA